MAKGEGHITDAGLSEDAAFPGRRSATRIDSNFGGQPPGGEGDGRKDRKTPLSPANRESDPE
jgi:hypothetical protein